MRYRPSYILIPRAVFLERLYSETGLLIQTYERRGMHDNDSRQYGVNI